jgi:hypothetical protein
MGNSPVTLDFSKAQPIAPVTLDFSKAQPLPRRDPMSSVNANMTAAMSGQRMQTPEDQAQFEQGKKAGTISAASQMATSGLVGPALAPTVSAAEVGTGILKSGRRRDHARGYAVWPVGGVAVFLPPACPEAPPARCGARGRGSNSQGGFWKEMSAGDCYFLLAQCGRGSIKSVAGGRGITGDSSSIDK